MMQDNGEGSSKKPSDHSYIGKGKGKMTESENKNVLNSKISNNSMYLGKGSVNSKGDLFFGLDQKGKQKINLRSPNLLNLIEETESSVSGTSTPKLSPNPNNGNFGISSANKNSNSSIDTTRAVVGTKQSCTDPENA